MSSVHTCLLLESCHSTQTHKVRNTRDETVTQLAWPNVHLPLKDSHHRLHPQTHPYTGLQRFRPSIRVTRGVAYRSRSFPARRHGEEIGSLRIDRYRIIRARGGTYRGSRGIHLPTLCQDFGRRAQAGVCRKCSASLPCFVGTCLDRDRFASLDFWGHRVW